MQLYQTNPSTRSSVCWSDLTASERLAIKALCEADHLTFNRLFFKELQGTSFRVGPHHRVVCRTLDRVFSGEINRLIVSVPPGYTKTETAVVAFIARGMAKNPRAKFIHASFSGELVNENSVRVKDVMSSEPYQAMWPIAFKDDQSAKGLWRTTEGGGLLAKPAGGPITGFRAGTMDEGFTGALVIDDPLKPDDAFSSVEREKINRRWHSTFKSRLAREDIPVIVIMQRLHSDDFAGFLLRGGADCKWHHLMLPVRVDSAASYPAEFSHGIPIDHGLPDGPLWPEKHSETHICQLESDAYTFASQYMQRPIALGGNLFKSAWIGTYKADELPALKWRAIYADTAQKVGEKNDFSVFQCWGAGVDGNAYLIDQVRGKFEAPELLSVARGFWVKHMQPHWNTHGVLRSMGIEDKVSGTGLIQQLARDGIPVTPIERGGSKDKYTRAMDVVAYFANMLVRVPADAPWIGDWMHEILQFTGLGDMHDDQVDPTVDAVRDILANANSYDWVA
jgi:predicted phage terminase large subunit-like protein